MDNQTIFTIIGYIASIILAISLLMKSLIRLRVLNGIGALIYIIYGILIEAYPVAVLNGIIFFIDLYFLVQMLQRRDYFTLMAVEPESAYLNHFIQFQNLDIQKFFPNFNYQPHQNDLIYFVLRNTVPAGLVIIRKEENHGEIILDYALKDYRDFRIGVFIFNENAKVLTDHGIKYLTIESKVPSHIRYLHQVGFSEAQGEKFIKELNPKIIRDKGF
jgi:hypothetical protein